MEIADGARLRITAYHGSGETAARARVVTTGDGRLGCSVAERFARLVERDPRVRVEGEAVVDATVVRSGRLHAEVHGRLRAARRLPGRAPAEPVLLIDRP